MTAIGTRHALSYGGNFRHNGFDISLAPDSEDRNEGGAYVQDEIFLSNQFRWVIGGRHRQVLVDRQRRLLAADDADVQAGGRIRRSASRSTARSARRRSSTTT